MDLALAIAWVLRRDERHVAIAASRALCRVIERSRALARNSARLPVVIVIETTEPAVLVHGHVQVHLMAGGTVLGCIQAYERLHERAAMWLGIEVGQEMVDRPKITVLTVGQ